MTHRYRIESSFGLLIDKYEGKMEWHDVWKGVLRTAEDPEFQQGMDVLADMTAADLDFGYEGARSMALEISMVPTLRYGRIAVVAPGALQFGVSRMFGMLLETFDIFAEYRVFSDFSKARTWLGLPKDVELRL